MDRGFDVEHGLEHELSRFNVLHTPMVPARDPLRKTSYPDTSAKVMAARAKRMVTVVVPGPRPM